MNANFATGCLIAGALLLPIAGYTADVDNVGNSVKTLVDDSVITTQVKANLAQEKLVSLIHISVQTDHSGVVYLTGTAATQVAVDKAVSIARAVPGVTSVHNGILINAD